MGNPTGMKNNSFFNKTFRWILTAFIIITLLMLFASAIVQMLAPTFFPETNISGFIDVIQTASILLSVLSLAFGVISLILSVESGKQAEKILQGVSDLKLQNSHMEFMMKNMNRTFSFENVGASPTPSNKPDDITD